MAGIESAEELGRQVGAALGGRLVSLVVYGSAARVGPDSVRVGVLRLKRSTRFVVFTRRIALPSMT